MVDLYTLSCIVNEAEEQAQRDGNARKYILARLYAGKHLEIPAKRGIQDDPMLDVRFFAQLLNYEAVSVEEWANAAGQPAI